MGIDVHGDNVELRACVGRKGHKEGSKLKSLTFTISGNAAISWAEAMRAMVFGNSSEMPTFVS